MQGLHLENLELLMAVLSLFRMGEVQISSLPKLYKIWLFRHRRIWLTSATPSPDYVTDGIL